ncbi:TPA: RES family NAD+ phosphorylase [Providencia alcalifaciens]
MDEKIREPDEMDNLSNKLITWPKGKKIERIHSVLFHAVQFNPGKGYSRFSPIFSQSGNNIPTLYGGINISVALMETLLHDLPTPCKNTPVELSLLSLLVRSQILPKEDIRLIDLNPRFMRKHGITQNHLLNSPSANYSSTQKWAEKVHGDNPEAQGIQWASKQHGDHAIMLFGDRVNHSNLNVNIDSEPALNSVDVNNELTLLADELDLILLPPNFL